MFSSGVYEFISLDLPALTTALFACLACALLGNFLVLRRISLMGDAISHAVLPGIVAGFLLTGSRSNITIFIGAALAGILTSVLVELVKNFGRLESGAAMGVVFSIMFASGVLLIEQAAARNIDLDADCLLHGQLETIFWYPPQSYDAFFRLSTLSFLPLEVISSVSVLVASALFVLLFYKELALTAFDEALATALGFSAKGMHYALMVFVAAAVVASFQAVGSILVIAMIIAPAATARLFTDRLRMQISLSLLLTVASVTSGYFAASFVPAWFGSEQAVNAAGSMTVMAGAILFAAALFAPKYGYFARTFRRFIMSVQVQRQDILAALYRYQENKSMGAGEPQKLFEDLQANITTRFALRRLIAEGKISKEGSVLHLTSAGHAAAAELIRSHRLWESFLVEHAGLQPDHVHHPAGRLEHYTEEEIREKLAESQAHVKLDPHGKPIP